MCEDFEKTGKHEYCKEVFKKLLTDQEGNPCDNSVIDSLTLTLTNLSTFLKEVPHPMWIRGSSLFLTFNRARYRQKQEDISRIADVKLIDFGWMDRIDASSKDYGFIKGVD